MALLFSAVRATANDQEVEFFVGGTPREYDDLEIFLYSTFTKCLIFSFFLINNIRVFMQKEKFL